MLFSVFYLFLFLSVGLLLARRAVPDGSAAVIVLLSVYTIGTTVRYDGINLGTVGSRRTVDQAVQQLETVTRQTLEDQDYAIDTALLQRLEIALGGFHDLRHASARVIQWIARQRTQVQHSDNRLFGLEHRG